MDKVTLEDLVEWIKTLKIVAITGYDEDGNKHFVTIHGP